MSTSFEPIPSSLAAQIAASNYTLSPEHLSVEVGQAEHRIQLVNQWRIPASSRILEIGCGQGTCTAVLAAAVGADGHVDAVDPSPPDYGAPVTLGQAQSHLSAGPFGSRITWHRAETTSFLADHPHERWDYAVLAHSIWYFDSPEELSEILPALKDRCGTLVVAEYALTATHAHALPHVLTAIAQGLLHREMQKPATEANIRCLLSPDGIKGAAQDAGWRLESESVVVPGDALLDGSWDTSMVQSRGFEEEVENIHDSTAKALLRSSRDAVAGAVKSLGGNKPRTMDVWVARFAS
ncbi:hypothetical protein CDD83_3019 [Cordyceps sp. RAO-2017]|nr:hypothetical protein CDD83_3019 [Cordyceps sp. RAO-2017]